MAVYQWPWEYNFPPFFTVQPHSKTKEQQLSTWRTLILGYQKHQRQAILNIAEDGPLFVNESISRKLAPEGRLWLLEELVKTGNAAPVDKRRQQWEIYWHTLDEWATIVHEWATGNGMTGTVCTIFELVAGDNTVGEEFHGLDQDVFKKVLKVLEGKGKCELIAFDDNEGVKFF
ncbi:vacuolar protein sorting-associated protein 25 [Culex quinquefasciatus]|uniref:Vacuolar protein-sorting-associated protein 25 n=1 Tax=Culex quinquefasciatus TaxID=7176 RepID=B0WSN7_CULQU|nr:vacuolar protein sorting-associated protein 25 [Culex quinquefasciatus]|eukprot:XP_001870695.1 vacuolar protein sorting-associated protein 25 [Culex quinquefasciatus]